VTIDSRHRPRRLTVLLPVVGLVVLAACGLTLLALSTAKVGLVAELVGVAAALLPVGPVVAAFLWIDRWEPEPAGLLWLAFGWGACLAAITALIMNNTAEAVGDLLLGKGNGDKLSAVFTAPVIEEALKAAFVLALLVRLRHEFDGVIDGIVYSGLCAAGFAFTENIYYFGRAFAEYGFGSITAPGVLLAFVLRGVLSPFTHPLFTCMTGIGIGIAARTNHRVLRVVAPGAGYVVAVVLHGLWNGSATLGGSDSFLVVYFLVMVPIFILGVLFVNWHRHREQRIVAAALPDMAAAKLIIPSDAEKLSSLVERAKWRKRIRAKHGVDAAEALREFQIAVSELAFLRNGMARGTVGDDAEDRQAVLIRAVRARRDRAAYLIRGTAAEPGSATG
jgi:protease PrsW